MNASALRILVAEDHAFQRNALVRVLRSLGAHDLLEAWDGASALQRFLQADRPVDVIISDLDMPGMDGIEFLRHIGQSGRHPSVVLASAMEGPVLASVQNMARAYGVRLLGVLAKPVSPQQLEELLAGHAGGVPAAAKLATIAVASADEIAAGLRQGEFEPFFQPKVELGSLALAGFEALARWRTAATGEVRLPATFLPVMEREGMVDALTWVMLEKAAGFCVAQRDAGRHCSVAVNLSASSLVDPQLAGRVTSIVQAAGLEPPRVILEITESCSVEDGLAPVLENLARLRLRGFGLSIDDYGTGYSSLQQLGRLPFTEMKIDRSFVENANRDGASLALLESSLDIARKLKLVSVAEGVETREQWDLLLRLGCDQVQGFLVAPAMPAQAAAEWARNWERQQAAVRAGSG